MAQSYVQPGEAIDYTVPSGGVTSGDIVIKGSLAGVALKTGVENDVISLGIEGVYDLPKIAGVITQGDIVYYDSDNEAVTTESEGGSPWGAFSRVGIATETVVSGAATVNVKLNV